MTCCALHPEREATAFCRTCGRPLCAEDQRSIYGVVYCQDCLARPMGQAPAGVAAAVSPGAATAPLPVPGYVPRPDAPNPGLACALGFIPGVGAVYNGQYLKAFVQVVIFAFLIALANWANTDATGTFAGLGIAAFYFYMVIDSYHTAKLIRSGQPADDFFGMAQPQWNAPTAAIVLIVIGAIFFLRSIGFFYYDFSRFIWPGVLIAIGVYLLLRHQGTVRS